MRYGIIKKISACAATFALIAGLTACGSDTTTIPQGKVVKGPVAGATVRDVNGNVVGITNSKGEFPLTGTGPYSSSGGTYFPLLANGTYDTTPLAAPPMKAPAGVTIITSLSTLVADASSADQEAIMATLEKIGISSLNTDLSIKTPENEHAFILSETVGAVIAKAVSSGATADELNSIISAVNTALSDGALADAETFDAETIATAVQAQITDALGNSDLAATLIEAATATATGADALEYYIPPPVTGTTGGTSGSGGTTIN